jgi:Na+-transporting methylmalonyl-CoA/oxaloacetate decarboxylase gamma subunit
MNSIPLQIASTFPLALIGADAGFAEFSIYQASAMTVVMLTLGGLWLAVAGVSKVVLAVERAMGVVPKPRAGVAAAPPALPAAEAAVPVAAVDTRTVAAITAAIHAVFGARARIVSLSPESGPGQAWSKEGRREIYQSHRVR